MFYECIFKNIPTHHLKKTTNQYLSLLRHNTEKGPPNTSERKRSYPYACLEWVAVAPWRYFLSHVFLISITHSLRALPSFFVPSRHRKLHQRWWKSKMTNSPSRSFNYTCTMMNKGLSNHGHYRNNHGFLFDVRPKLQVFHLEDAELAPALLRVPRARDLSLAALQVPIAPHRPMCQKRLKSRTWKKFNECDRPTRYEVYHSGSFSKTFMRKQILPIETRPILGMCSMYTYSAFANSCPMQIDTFLFPLIHSHNVILSSNKFS